MTTLGEESVTIKCEAKKGVCNPLYDLPLPQILSQLLTPGTSAGEGGAPVTTTGKTTSFLSCKTVNVCENPNLLNRDKAKLSGQGHSSETIQPNPEAKGWTDLLPAAGQRRQAASHSQQDLLRPIHEPGSEPVPGQQNDHRPSSKGSWASGVTDKTAGGHTQSGRWKQKRSHALFCLESEKATRKSPECVPCLGQCPALKSGGPGQEPPCEDMDMCVQYIMVRGPYNIFSIKRRNQTCILEKGICGIPARVRQVPGRSRPSLSVCYSCSWHACSNRCGALFKGAGKGVYLEGRGGPRGRTCRDPVRTGKDQNSCSGAHV